MAYSCQIVDTSTGAKLAAVQPAAGTWKTLIDGVGTGSTAFRLRDAANARSRATWRDLARPWARTLVVSWRGFAVYAGLIDDHDWDRDAGVLTLQHQEVRALLARRMGPRVTTYNPNGLSVVEGRSLRGAARLIAVRGLTDAPGDGWTIPLVAVGFDGETGSERFEWSHNEFVSYEAMLAEVSNADGGPDVAFDPVWSTSGRLEWWLRVGQPRLPGMTLGGTFEWNLDAQQHPVRAFRERVSGSDMATGIFGLGVGSGADRLVGLSEGEPGPQVPTMHIAQSFQSINDQTRLNSATRSELRARRSPTVSNQFKVQLDDRLPLGDTFRLGAKPRIFTAGDEFMEPGWREGYFVALGGDLGSTVLDVEVQPL